MKHLVYLILPVLLISCSKDDEIAIPTYLEFQELTTIEGQNLSIASGFLGSEEHNSLFIALRENNPDSDIENSERVVRYDLQTGKQHSVYFDQTDFVTKQLHIIEDELVVVGGQFINTYPISLDREPRSVAHGKALSRFGSVDYKGKIYIWGGDLLGLDSDIIYEWDNSTNELEWYGFLPTPKTWAHGEVVGDWLYIFGGQEEFSQTPPNDIIYIFDIPDTVVATMHLPRAVNRTWTARHDELIYVGGHVNDNEFDAADNNIFFGVFNTRELSFKEVDISLSDAGLNTIYQMTTIGKQMFVLYGVQEDVTTTFKIMVANLP